MKAMVLAAGKGERLRPLTDRLPKPLIPVAGKPLIHYTLTYLKNCGIEETVVNLHHLGRKIQAYLRDGKPWGLTIRYSWEEDLLGTGGGIQKASPYLADGAFVVMNADILVELNLQEVIRFHRECDAAVTMVLRKDPDVDRFGAIEVDAYGQIRQILGKLPVSPGPRKRLMFTGLHVLEPKVFSYMPHDKACFSIVEVYLTMLRAGERILGYEMKGFWTDLGTQARYEEFQRFQDGEDISMQRFIGGCTEDHTGTLRFKRSNR